MRSIISSTGKVQFDNSNSDNSNSLLTQTEFPSLELFLFPFRVQVTGVLLYLEQCEDTDF